MRLLCTEGQIFFHLCFFPRASFNGALQHHTQHSSNSNSNNSINMPAGKRKGGKKKGAKKDPNKPKRAMSSFMFFANDKRQEVRDANPDMKITEVGKRLGEMWKQLTDAEKKVCLHIRLILTC